jgi:iron complex outermembrane recepter protein
MRSLWLLAGLFSFASGASAAPAYEPVPNVIGFVRDTAGNPLPGVEIVVERLNRTTTTDARGRFMLRSLRAGTYHLDAHLIGYANAHAVVTLPPEGKDVSITLIMRLSPLEIGALHVTATPNAASPVNSTQAATEVSGQALVRDLTSSVAQTLAVHPGLATRYAGPAASTPVIRGMSGERVLVVEDGQRAGDLSSTSSDHALSIDPLAASRIEVVRGPASLLYGNNALGGVVNVVSNNIPTSLPSGPDGYFALQGESVNPGGAISGSISMPIGSEIAVTFRGGGRNINDVRVGGPGILGNSDAQNMYGTAGLGYVTERLTGGVAVQMYDFNYGIPAAADDAEAGIRIDGRRYSLESRAELSVASSGFTDLRVDGTAQSYTHDEIEPGGEVGTTFKLTTQTAGATARTTFGFVTGSVGLSVLFRQYEALGEEALTPGADSNTGGIFIYQEMPLGHETEEGAGQHDGGARLQVGARYDLYLIDTKETERFGPAESRRFNNFSGSIGISAPLGHVATVGLSVARAFRAPTVEELYANAFHAATASFERGNRTLDSETNMGIDGVLRLQSGRTHGQFSGYYNRVKDYIFASILGDTIDDSSAQLIPLNVYDQRDADIRGLEAEIESEIARHVVLGIMGDVLRGTFGDGEPLPFMPAARVGGTARYDNGRYSLGLDVRHAFAQNDVPTNEFATGDYDLINLSAGLNMIVRGLVHTLTLRVDNALDEEYRDATSRIKRFAPNPGRNLTLVYRVLF